MRNIDLLWSGRTHHWRLSPCPDTKSSQATLARWCGGSHGGGSHSEYGTGSNSSSHSVHGYSKRDGTYVQPHHQTNPNSTTRGNVNPYTGKVGTRSPKD